MNTADTSESQTPESEGPEEASSAEEQAASSETGDSEAGAPDIEAPDAEAVGGDEPSEVEMLKDRLLRAVAETENVRRRAEREKEETAKFAISNFARDLLPVADNLGRTLDNIPEQLREDETMKAFLEGVELTGRELVKAFEKHGITHIHPEGEKFDHNVHQAMFEVEDNEKPHGTVTQVVQSGYLIENRLLRPAMVGVSKSSAEKNAEPGDEIDVEA